MREVVVPLVAVSLAALALGTSASAAPFYNAALVKDINPGA